MALASGLRGLSVLPWAGLAAGTVGQRRSMRRRLAQRRCNAPAALLPRGGHGDLHTLGDQSHNLERNKQLDA